MAQKYRIDQETCVQCAACPPECPVAAITPDAPFVIDPEICTDCGNCAAVCPVEAISQYDYTPPEPPTPTTPPTALTVGLGVHLQ